MYTAMLTPESLTPPMLESSENTLVCLLGPFCVVKHGRPLEHVVAGKAVTLLAELALHMESGVSREELLETLWPEQDATQAAVSLNSLIYSVQRRLRDHVQGPAVVYVNGCYGLNKAADLGTDIARFDNYIRYGMRMVADDDENAAAYAFEHAVALYRGDLCAGSSVSAVIERERLRTSLLRVLAWLGDQAYRAGNEPAALEYALRLLTFDPCREDAHRLVMRVHVHQGQRAQALRQYRVCELVLRREFQAVPELETSQLFDQIRHDPASI
jgi:DNA-binding SARP family transcriptional activator